jgi:hypothetical protein
MNATRAARALGLRVVWTAEGAVDDTLAAILGPTEPADAPPGDLTLSFSAVDTPLPYGAPPGFAGSFYQDRIVAFANSNTFLFQDDASQILVPLDGGPIVGRMHASSTSDRAALRLMLDLVLTMAVRARAIFHLHAGGVVRGDTCILLSGESGTGKTSSTLALVEAGWSYLSDDSVFLRTGLDGAVHVAAPRRPFHLTEATLAAHPRLAALATPSACEPSKCSVAGESAFPERFCAAAPAPSILLFPVVKGGDTTTVERLADADAFGRLLMASTMLSVSRTPHTGPHLSVLKALVEGAACFELRLARDLLRTPARAVNDVIEPLVARAPRRRAVAVDALALARVGDDDRSS